jgi:hypothetical protein
VPEEIADDDMTTEEVIHNPDVDELAGDECNTEFASLFYWYIEDYHEVGEGKWSIERIVE